MQKVSLFSIVIVFFLSVVFFVWAKDPDNKWDGPYNASALADREGIGVSGWSKARGTGAVRNGSYMCSMSLAVVGGVGTPDSDSDIRGAFDGDSDWTGNSVYNLYANSDAWGSNKHGELYDATASSESGGDETSS